MVRRLTGSDISEIIEECRVNGEFSQYTAGPESFSRMPLSLGWGCGREMQLRPGLCLSVADIKKRQTHRQIIQHGQRRPLTLNFYLSGGCWVDNDGLQGTQEEIAGKSYLYCLPNTAEIEERYAGQRIQTVAIRILPELMPCFNDCLHEFPSDLRQAIENPTKAQLYCPSQITPAQQHILQQIMQWPYQGITRQFYLEGKVLELLALYFDQILTAVPAPPPKLQAVEIDRIYQARDLLIANMTHPPSIPELARQVQLNERKLKEGFRQVFSTTVFGYLHDHRMEEARHLLQTGQLNIQETARRVGYASRSSFVVAFKKKFQVPPSSYLKGMGA